MISVRRSKPQQDEVWLDVSSSHLRNTRNKGCVFSWLNKETSTVINHLRSVDAAPSSSASFLFCSISSGVNFFRSSPASAATMDRCAPVALDQVRGHTRVVREMQIMMGDVFIFILLSHSLLYLVLQILISVRKTKHTNQIHKASLKKEKKLKKSQNSLHFCQQKRKMPDSSPFPAETSVATMIHLMQQSSEPFSHGLDAIRGSQPPGPSKSWKPMVQYQYQYQYQYHYHYQYQYQYHYHYQYQYQYQYHYHYHYQYQYLYQYQYQYHYHYHYHYQYQYQYQYQYHYHYQYQYQYQYQYLSIYIYILNPIKYQ